MTYKAKKNIAIVVAILSVFALVGINGAHRVAMREQYAKEHNCEWNYETRGDFDAEPICIAK